MIRSIDALVLKNGNVVRRGLASPATVARYLARVSPLADYEVRFWRDGVPHRVTGEGFLTLYEAGHLPRPHPMGPPGRRAGGRRRQSPRAAVVGSPCTTQKEPPMDDELMHAAIEAQWLMGPCVPCAQMALDRTTITDWSWEEEQVRQALDVPATDAVWDERVLALEAQGLASFSVYAAPLTRAADGTEHELPGWRDQPREDWGAVGIHPEGVLRLAALYGHPPGPVDASTLLAHWQGVQAASAARLAHWLAQRPRSPEDL